MNRRDRAKPPKPGMVWSEKHRLWMDPDTRTAERKAHDQLIARNAESDRKRLGEALRRANEAQEKHSGVVDAAAQRQAQEVLEQFVRARKDAGLSQTEVGRRMNVSQSAVVRIESGLHSPTLTTLSRYAVAVGIRIGVFGRSMDAVVPLHVGWGSPGTTMSPSGSRWEFPVNRDALLSLNATDGEKAPATYWKERL